MPRLEGFQTQTRTLTFNDADGVPFEVVIRFVDLAAVIAGGGSIPSLAAAAGGAPDRVETLRRAARTFAQHGVVSPDVFATDDSGVCLWDRLPLQYQQRISEAICVLSGIGEGADADLARSFPAPGGR